MYKIGRIVIVFVFVIVVSRTVWAVSCPDGTPETTIFFVNGVLNDEDEARKSTKKLNENLQDFINVNPLRSGCVKEEMRYAYNHTQGLILDLYESYTQIEDDIPLFWRILAHRILAPIEVSRNFTNFILGVDLDSFVILDDLEEHLVKYTDEIFDGNRVIAVAHSQGNLYANEAHNLLYNPAIIPPGSFSIVSVATPAGFVAGYEQGEELYTTLEGDFIHHVPGALEWNIPDTDCGSPWACHAFVNSYLNRSASRSQIMEHIVGAIIAAPHPMPDSLNPFRNVTIAGDYAAAGVGLRDTTQGSITISGIPPGASVIEAFLYWGMLDDGESPSLRNLNFNTTPITGTLIGSGDDTCWGRTNSFAYRADVTPLSYALCTE